MEETDYGVFGVLSGDTDENLYRLSANQFSQVNQVAGIRPQEFEKIFDGNLRKRPDAYKSLVDLKELRKQIDDNIEALGDVRSELQKNIELVRGAGFAFLELSDQIGNENDADVVARLLQSRIRQNAPQALGAAENLSDIAVVALASLNTESEG